MNRVFIILGFITLLVAGVRAQQTLDIFKHEIPGKVLKNKLFRAEVEKNIREYGQLDPRLIYPYLESLRLRFEQNKNDRQNPFLWYSNMQVNKIRRDRKKYLERAEQRIGQSGLDKSDREKLSLFINDLLAGSNKVLPTNNLRDEALPPEDYDPARRDFMAWLYLSQKTGERYDPGTDYAALADEQYRKRIRRFTEWYEQAGDISFLNTPRLKSATEDGLYLFKESYVAGLPATAFTLSRFLTAVWQRQDGMIFFRGGGFSPFAEERFQRTDILISVQSPVPQNLTVPSATFTDPFGYSYELNPDDAQSADVWSFGLGYTLPLQPEKGMLSYLRFFVHLSQKQFIGEKQDLLIKNATREEVGKYSISGKYSGWQEPSEKFWISEIKLSTPVFFWGKNFALEIGGVLHYGRGSIPYKVKFDGIVNIYDANYEPDPFYTKNKPLQTDIEGTLIVVKPLISMKYTLYNHLLIGVDYGFNGGVQFGLALRMPYN